MPYIIQLTTKADTAALKEVTQGLDESAKAAEAAADGLDKMGDKAAEAEGKLQRVARATQDWKKMAAEMGAEPGSPMWKKAHGGGDDDDLDSFLEGMSGGDGDMSAADRLAEQKGNRDKARRDGAERAARAIAEAREKTEATMAERRTKRMAEEHQAAEAALRSGAMRWAAWGTAALTAGAMARSALKGFIDQNPEVERSLKRLGAAAQAELGAKFTKAVEWAFGPNVLSQLEKFSKQMSGAADVVAMMGKASAAVRQANYADVLEKEVIALERSIALMNEREEYLKRELEHSKEMSKFQLQKDLSALEQADLPESEKTMRRRQLQRDAGWNELEIDDAIRRTDERKVAAEGAKRGEARAEAEYRSKWTDDMIRAIEGVQTKKAEVSGSEAVLARSGGTAPQTKMGPTGVFVEPGVPAMPNEEKQALQKRLDQEKAALEKQFKVVRGMYEDPNITEAAKDRFRKAEDSVRSGNGDANQLMEELRRIGQEVADEAKRAREEAQKASDEWQKTHDRNTQTRANEGEKWLEREGIEDEKAGREADKQRSQEDMAEARQTLESTDKAVTEDSKKLVEGLKAMEAKKRGVDNATADAMAKLAESIADGIAPGELQKVQNALNNMGGEVANGFSAMASAMSSVAIKLESSTKDLNAVKSRLESLETAASAQR